MKSVWKISYTERNKGQTLADVEIGRVDHTVCFAARTAEEAIARLRKKEVGGQWTWDDDDGKKHTETVEELLLVSVEHEGRLDG